jgi:cell fate (sporulation/competence/biofilm development) regulator YmcA (YheA/YmcA/DUF963 family)
MTELARKTAALKEALLALPEVKRFFSLRDQIAEDTYLMTQQELAKEHQKKMMKTIHEAQLYQHHKAQYEHYLSLFQNHPLVQTYEAIKAEIKPLLDQLQSILE